MTDQNTFASTPVTRHPKPHLTVINGTVKATSLDVAEKFEKQHDNVIRDIKALECPEDFSLLNFEESDYVNSRGKTYPMYEMTRDGFTVLAMGFTGKKAMEWKIKYLTAFNLMEKHIIEQQRKALPTPTTLTPAQQRQIQKLVNAKASLSTPDGKPNRGMFPKIYRSIKDHFQVGKYSQIPQSRFNELTDFLGGARIWEDTPDPRLSDADKKAIWKNIYANRQIISSGMTKIQNILPEMFVAISRMGKAEALIDPESEILNMVNWNRKWGEENPLRAKQLQE